MLMKKTLLTFFFAIAATFAVAQTKTFTDNLTISMDGEVIDSQTSTITVKKESDNTYTLALNNFLLMGEGIGNIVINGITANEENSIKNFSVEQNITITEGDSEDVEFWLGPELGEIPVALNGKMTEHKLYCNINIDILGVAVTFGQADLAGINNIESENGANVIYDLTGRKVDAITTAGIYIVNGKKVLVK